MKKGKKRHFTPAELCQMAKNTAKERQVAYRSPFTMMSVYCNHVLFFEEKMSTPKLAEYNKLTREYYNSLEENNEILNDLLKRIEEKANFPIGFNPFTEDNIPKDMKKGSYVYELQKKVVEHNNMVNEMSVKYLACNFCALMDMGWGKIRLNRLKDRLNEILAEHESDDGDACLKMREELIERAGLEIEMPKVYK